MNEIIDILRKNGWEESLIKNIEYMNSQLPKNYTIGGIEEQSNITTCIDSKDIKIDLITTRDFNSFQL